MDALMMRRKKKADSLRRGLPQPVQSDEPRLLPNPPELWRRPDRMRKCHTLLLWNNL